MAEQWLSAGFRVVQILWTADRVPVHALDLPEQVEIDPAYVIFHHELPIASRQDAIAAVAELNQETLSTWLESSWHAVFEVQEPEECWGQIYDTNLGHEEDWVFYRKASLVTPTKQEISQHCLVS